MCNEIKRKCKTIRCAKDNKMCKKDVQKTTRCAKNNKMYKKEKLVVVLVVLPHFIEKMRYDFFKNDPFYSI